VVRPGTNIWPRWSGPLGPDSSFVAATVEPGSTLLTDGWQGYKPPRDRFDHHPVAVGEAANASNVLPQIHPTFSNLETWLKRTHHRVGTRHLPHYLDEFVFRHNRRKTPMAAFQSLFGPTSRHQPTIYKMLFHAELTGSASIP